MGTQTQVNTEFAVAVPGQKATPDQAVYTPINYIAGDGGVAAGLFAFADSDNAGVALAANESATAVLGFVERVIGTYIYTVTESGTEVVAAGDALTIAVKGDYYVSAPGTVAVGDSVYVDASTGALSTDSTAVDTGWTYKTAGDEADLVIISNW